MTLVMRVRVTLVITNEGEGDTRNEGEGDTRNEGELEGLQLGVLKLEQAG